ncbi:HNH endonuclease [Bacillaceae bacterium Marseille-Q3522]|nr:HNH endonuclease [Bacillaceae bacterium Marseille-Q3522]
MSEIQIKVDELEAFADEIKKAEWHCDDALDALNWHLSSLLANFPGVLPDVIQDLEAEFRHSIELYQGKLDEAQALIKLTAAEMREADQKLAGKIGEFLLDVVGWYDIQRIYSEYDPVTGEKLGAGDRLLALGMVATSVFPPGKLASVGGKSVAKGVKAGIETASKTGFPSLAENAGAFKKMKNVINPKKVKEAFDFVYTQVIKAPISATKYWFDQVIKKLGDVPIPAFFQTQLVGIGAVQKTVRESFEEAKETIVRMIRKVDGDVEDIKGTGNVNLKNIDEFIDGTKTFDDVVDDFARLYSEKIQTNKTWSWNKSFHGGEYLTARQRKLIKEKAIAVGLIPNVNVIKADGMKYGFADFKSAGLVVETKDLPESLWLKSDEVQFEWLDNVIGGRPEGMTWHHTEVPGKMELVPFGIHNITIHNGGRSTGMWADAPR